MKNLLTHAVVLGFLMVGAAFAQESNSKPEAVSFKPRVINTTDLGADPDDEQSMVRQLVCANEFDIEGLIVSTGCWKKTQTDTRMLDKLIDAYAECVDNLRVHANGFPSVEYLRSISVMGQKGYGMSDVGDGKDSPGSQLIIAAVDKGDPRPVWIGGWGGTNNVAQAIWKVRATRSKEELSKFLSKLRVFDILGQDDAGAWIAKNFPEVLYIRATGVYGWQPPKNGSYQKDDIQSHGPLGAVYPDTIWASEGDTPAFMHIYPNGLNDPDKIDQGGWGGRFSLQKQAGIRSMKPVTNEGEFDPYFMYGNTAEGTKAIKRWSSGYNNDFAARMDWSIAGKYEDANHHPVAVVNGDTSRRVLEVSAVPGSHIELSAKGSSDPDNDNLNYAWSFYDEPSSCDGVIEIEGSTSDSATVTIPATAAGKNLHVILELHDDGEPKLFAYRRVIIHVADAQASTVSEINQEQQAKATSQESSLPKTQPNANRLRVVMMSNIPPIGVVKAGNVPNDQKSDPDDMRSIVRFLLHANEFDIEGLVVTSGTFANTVNKQNMLDVIDRYAMVYENLKKHDPMYPTPDDLRNVTFGDRSGTWGRKGTANIGDGKDSEASDALNDPDDPTQETWGGQYKRLQGTNHYIDGLGGSSISKWRKDFQKEFAERADWCIK